MADRTGNASRPPREHLLTAAELAALPETRLEHQHNPQAVRYFRSLGDRFGFARTGVHLVRIAPGSASSELHNHEMEEEWVYVLSGRGLACIGEERFEVAPGDFLAYPPFGPAHNIENPFAEDIVLLVGGSREDSDICNYPRVGRRQWKTGEVREWVEADTVRIVRRKAEKGPPPPKGP